MGYKHDMSKEKSRKDLLPEGQRKFQIVGCKEAVAKSSGNDMFIFTFKDVITEQEEEVYAIAVKGKRWFLKSILAACRIEASKDGVYEWEISHVMDKIVLGTVIHFEDEWINRSGNTVKVTKHKITDIEETTPF
jgi:hypothetical protein